MLLLSEFFVNELRKFSTTVVNDLKAKYTRKKSEPPENIKKIKGPILWSGRLNFRGVVEISIGFKNPFVLSSRWFFQNNLFPPVSYQPARLQYRYVTLYKCILRVSTSFVMLIKSKIPLINSNIEQNLAKPWKCYIIQKSTFRQNDNINPKGI